MTRFGHWMLSEKWLYADQSGAWFVYCAPLRTVQNQQPAYRGTNSEPTARPSLKAARTMTRDATGDGDVTVYPPLNDSSGRSLRRMRVSPRWARITAEMSL